MVTFCFSCMLVIFDVYDRQTEKKHSAGSSCSVAGFRTLCLPNSSHVIIHFPPLFRKIPPIRRIAMKFVEKGDVLTEYDYRQCARKDSKDGLSCVTSLNGFIFITRTCLRIADKCLISRMQVLGFNRILLKYSFSQVLKVRRCVLLLQFHSSISFNQERLWMTRKPFDSEV